MLSSFQVRSSFFSDEDVLSSLHRFRPRFLATADGLPSYYDPYEFEHTCLLKCQQQADKDALPVDNEHPESSTEVMKCVAVPFVASRHFRTNDMVENLATTIKEVSSLDILLFFILDIN